MFCIRNFNPIIPDTQEQARAKLDRVLYWYDSSEYSQMRWNKGWDIANQILLSAAIVGALIFLALLGLPELAIALIPVSFMIQVATICCTIDNVDIMERSCRSTINDRVAISVEELNEALYPTAVVDAQNEDEYLNASAPPMAQAVYSK